MSLVCIVAIRSGSKGIKDKNIRFLCGKPLVCHTIDIALTSNLFDEIVVTTDSEDYISLLKGYYLNEEDKLRYLLRSSSLATDTTPKSDVLLDVFERLGYSGDTVFVELQVTSPIRTREYLVDVLEVYESSGKPSLITVKPFDRNINLVAPIVEGSLFSLSAISPSNTNRQSQGQLYYPDGSIWVSTVGNFKETGSFYSNKDTVGYISPPWSRYDIDTEYDFKVVELLIPSLIADGVLLND